MTAEGKKIIWRWALGITGTSQKREVDGHFLLMGRQRDDSVILKWPLKQIPANFGEKKRNQILKSRCGRKTFHADEERKEPASWPLFLGLLALGSLLHPMV